MTIPKYVGIPYNGFNIYLEEIISLHVIGSGVDSELIIFQEVQCKRCERCGSENDSSTYSSLCTHSWFTHFFRRLHPAQHFIYTHMKYFLMGLIYQLNFI